MSEVCVHDYAAVIATPLPGGLRLGLRADTQAIGEIDFLPASTPLQVAHTALVQEAVVQLQRYFSSPRQGFTLPLAPAGTAFQQRVWQALCAIPPGRPRSYGTLARELASSARAVAGACRANPLPLIIPCHRVVAATGPGGYMGALAGDALTLKLWLLEHEAAGG